MIRLWIFVPVVQALSLTAIDLDFTSVISGVSSSISMLESPVTACLGAIEKMPAEAKMSMVLATGKNIPYDSGKYQVCLNMNEAYNVPTKFFIVNYVLSMGKQTLPGELGVCLPEECENDHFETIRGLVAAGVVNVTNSVKSLAKSLHFSKQYKGDWPAPKGRVAYPNPFNNQDNRLRWGKGTSFAIAVICILVALVVYSTLIVNRAMRRARQAAAIDGVLLPDGSRPEPRLQLTKAHAMCEAFSLTGPNGTWTTLWNCGVSRPTDCLNGMRVISMFFIIMGHGLLEPMNIAGYYNAECIAKTPFCLDAAATNVWTYILLAGQLGVDTFFFIAGFLLSFVGKSRSMPIFMGTALRYARLMPLFGFVMLFYVLISPYLAFGPFSPRLQSDIFTSCGDNTWWSELIFINAFYPWYTNDGGCMGWSWYLGIDMVFAIFGLCLLNMWKRFPRATWAIAFISFSACIAVTIQQSLHYELQYNVLSPSFAVYGHYLYSRPYSRLPGFLFGLVTPWALHSLEKRGWARESAPRSILAKAVVLFACLVAAVVAAGCIFIPFFNSEGPGPYSTARHAMTWTPWQNALWIALNRPVWVLCWLIWTLACYFDYLPFFNAILAHRFWAPLASLTYGAYLIHPILIKVTAGNADGYYFYSPADALQRTVWFILLAYSCAVVLWCLIEKPMATMTGWLVPKKRIAVRKAEQNPSTEGASA